MSQTETKETAGIKIGKKAFITAVVILAALITLSGVLTRVIPSGHYERDLSSGRAVVIPDSYTEDEKEILPVIRWYTAPVEVIWGDNAQMIAVLILFMIFMGGAFQILDRAKVMELMLAGVVDRFKERKYLLMALILFFFMFSGAVLGIFEAMIPLIVFVVPLALIMGWDSMTGLGMSLMGVAFGFSAAVTNPFSIGVAQTLAELPLFSGAWLRIIFFILVYTSTFLFLSHYAKKVENDPKASVVYKEDTALREKYSKESLLSDEGLRENPGMRRAIKFSLICLGSSVLFIIVAALVPFIPTDAAFPVIALLFLIAGLGGGLMAGMKKREVMSSFGHGAMNMVPGIVLILLAMSVPHIITRGGVMDTILYSASEVISGTEPVAAVFLVYLLTLILNFFISSASAKSFLMIPILAPLCDLVGVTRQTAVMAYNFGDGFSNMLYPTNALLLVGLGLTVVGYPKWVKWSMKIQIPIFLLSMLFLYIAVTIGYGPF